MIYEWGPRKAAAIRRKHNLDFEQASTVFLDPFALTFDDPGHSILEHREVTIGSTMKGLCVFVAHCERKGRIRIISARPATKSERKQYEETIDP